MSLESGVDSEPLAVDDAIDAFVAQNEETWNSFIDEEADGHVLVDVTLDEPKYIQYHCIVGNYVANVLGLQPLYLVGSSTPAQRRICQSYFSGEFASVTKSAMDAQSLLAGVKSFAKTLGSTHLDIEDLIAATIDGVQIGDLVYNTTMRNTGKGTFETVSPSVARYLLSGCLLYHQTRRIFDRYDIRAFVASHFFYVRCGIPARIAIDEGADVFVPKSNATLRKYTSLEETQTVPLRPSENLFEYVYAEYKDQAVRRSSQVMADRIGVSPDRFRNEGAETFEAGESVSRLTDETLPTVLVMPHIFIEPLRSPQKLFRDYLVWLRETVSFIADETSTNWLIKPHPHEPRYEQDPETREVVQLALDGREAPTVTMLDESVEHRDLIPAVDAILTVDGTGGMEYACYGIPSIVASWGLYSGFGFTHQPGSIDEYFEMLGSIQDIEPLSEDAWKRAMVMSYIHFCLMDVDPEMVPDFSTVSSDYEAAKWELSVETVAESCPETDRYYELMEDFLRSDAINMIDTTEIELPPAARVPEGSPT